MKRNFKDPMLSKQYAALMEAPQETIDTKILNRGGSLQVAFTWGWNGHPLVGVHNYGRQSLTYAAYCAGKDRKAQQDSGQGT